MAKQRCAQVSMRHFRSLYVQNHVGVPIPTPTEEDVFRELGLRYTPPQDRDPVRCGC